MNIDLETFSMLGPWAWIVVGVFFCTAEMLAPGAFLLWLGLAAIATGLVTMIMPLAGAMTLVLFAGLGIAFAALGYRVYGVRRNGTVGPEPNQGAREFIGREFLLAEPIVQGQGSIKLRDSVWRVSGPDLPVGRMVRVVAVERGVMLRVEAA